MSRASARCASRASGRAPPRPRAPRSLRARQLREPAQVRADVAVVGVQPVLVERVRRRAGRVEPDRLAALALAELGPRRREEELVGEAVGRIRGPGRRSPVAFPRPARPPDQLEAGGDVAPLVGAAHLQLDADRPVHVGEVVRLEQHVAELGERQAALQPHLDRVLGEHVRHRRSACGVAQEVDQRQLAEPVEVVEPHRARPGVKSRTPAPAAAHPSTFAASVSRIQEVRSLERPDGSPIIPVPPPTSAMVGRVTLQAQQPEDRHNGRRGATARRGRPM